MARDASDEVLRTRLERLLRAVPEAPGLTVSTEASTRRPRVVARASLGLTGLTVALIAVVVGVIAFANRPNAGGPLTSVATDGPFKLTLTIPKARYAAGEPISGVTASIEYLGSDASVTIGSDSQLIFFGLAEVGGTRHLSPVSDLMCGSFVLKPGEPLTKAYAKSGASSDEDPNAEWFKSMFARPDLALGAGRWTFTASTSISLRDCHSPAAYTLSTSVTISVGDPEPSLAAPASPSAATADLGSADWWVDPAFGSLEQDATVIHGLLVERSCASGASPEGRIVGPDTTYHQDAVVITYRVRTIGGTCPGNPRYPVTIHLSEPLGGRMVVDGGSGRDALIDPTVVAEPREDCGPLVGTNDAKIACMALVQAALGDRFQYFASVSVLSNGPACTASECTDAASIEARSWHVQATDVADANYGWDCAYLGDVATCTLQTRPTSSSRPGDPTLVAGDPRFAACGISLERTWMAFTMDHASDFTQHFPGWSSGAQELEVDAPALVVISTGQEVRGGNPAAASQAPELAYEMCIAVGSPSDALVHHYGPTRFDAVVPVLGGPAVPMP